MGKKVALSSNFNILTAKKVLQEYNFFRELAPSLSNNKDTANS